MNLKNTFTLLFISLVISVLLYVKSVTELEFTLTSNEWVSQSILLPSTEVGMPFSEHFEPIERIHFHSNTRYLSNGEYVKSSKVDIYVSEYHEFPVPSSVIEFAESGNWQLEDQYLIITNATYNYIPIGGVINLTEDQLTYIQNRYSFEAQKSRRVEIINDHSLLLTNLSNDAQILFSN